MKKSVAIIPARGGSKRIPKKNIKLFHGKPLIAYSIEKALETNIFDKVIVTTDDKDIANIANQYGAETPFIRPEELSDDLTTSGDAVNHTINWLKSNNEHYDFACTIYATAPLLDINYIKKGYEILKESNAHMAFAVTSMPFPIQRTFKITNNNRCQMFTPEYFYKRSQDLEEAFQDAGQFYWENLHNNFTDIPFGQDSIPIKIPRYLVQDLDTLEDWVKLEYMYKAIYMQNNKI